MIGRLAWYALLLVLAALVAAVQLDREAERNPALAALVPQPLRNTALVPLTIEALAAKDPQAALAQARKLVQRRPVPAEHLTLLAMAEGSAGREGKADVIIEQAARRGWREPVAQEAMLGFALNAGDRAEAARRYTALFLSRSTPDEQLAALGSEVFGGAAGPAQQTMAEIVAGGARWHPAFLERGPRTMPPAAFAEVANGAAARGARFDCAALAVAIAAVAQQDAASAGVIGRGAGTACKGSAQPR